MTTEEFSQIVRDWIATARNPKTGRPYNEMIYPPMVELLGYLRKGFKTFIVSGGGVEFMRPWIEKAYAIPPELVVGSSGKLKFELRDGKYVIGNCPNSTSLMTKAGKPVQYPEPHRPSAGRRLW